MTLLSPLPQLSDEDGDAAAAFLLSRGPVVQSGARVACRQLLRPSPSSAGTGGGVYVVECVWERGPGSLSHDRSGPRARHTPGSSI